jgi:hypothetical protein
VAAALTALIEGDGRRVVGPGRRSRPRWREPIDAALLEFRLGRAESTPVAECLDARGIPFAIVTGYDEQVPPAHLRNALRLAKPYVDDDIRRLLARLGGHGVRPKA